MRRPLLVLSLFALALVAAACSSGTAPGWTYAPPTEAPASGAPASGGPSGAAPASGAPSAAPSGAPASGAPSAAPSAGAPTEVPGGGGGSGTVVQVSAQNIAFEQSEISAPAGSAFTIHFENKDASVPHDIAIKDPSGAQVFKGDVVTGPGQADYQVPALQAGTYTFVCTIHPNMTGTLKVGG